ncbi:MAG TPA: hypothetical protein VGC41_21000, partial [Kofleriaceae bacterium]
MTASEAGTAIGISSRICASALPCGSKRSDAIPPPPSASAATKLNASSPGQSKRRTAPRIRCEKYHL